MRFSEWKEDSFVAAFFCIPNHVFFLPFYTSFFSLYFPLYSHRSPFGQSRVRKYFRSFPLRNAQ
ncbi:hypothetical protein PRIPAC_74376 [Pristionchus pacificus]|uniref:Uncharacterized protein n=1 Tax=Pristionchus pacificus TaxID=54126 RepID=A0A2A6C9Z4_PRIPA|nr:hypothetical protein PRIPAC_74376 [Pristionchus pacificus]|eukprot:PDM74969.1 hypothetical protein PRIPAC_40350 [Pristionchus pacificus]